MTIVNNLTRWHDVKMAYMVSGASQGAFNLICTVLHEENNYVLSKRLGCVAYMAMFPRDYSAEYLWMDGGPWRVRGEGNDDDKHITDNDD